jgi:hypothetical protein
MTSHDGEAQAWAARAPHVPHAWFVHPSRLHGVRHTQRVHIHAQRLTSELRWDDADTSLVLRAALWHDIGRTNDGEDPRHGAQSAARLLELGLLDGSAEPDGDLVLFAIVHHCLRDEDAREALPWWHAARLRGAARRPGGARAAGADVDPHATTGAVPRPLVEPERALRILWLLKDADALDRVRLQAWEAADPGMLRFPETAALLPFADALYRLTERAGR